MYQPNFLYPLIALFLLLQGSVLCVVTEDRVVTDPLLRSIGGGSGGGILGGLFNKTNSGSGSVGGGLLNLFNKTGSGGGLFDIFSKPSGGSGGLFNFNKTSLFKPKTTSTTPTTTTTATPPGVVCTCGTGAKPKINFTADPDTTEEDDDLRLPWRDDVGDDDFSLDEEEGIPDRTLPVGGQARIVHGIAANPHGWPWMAAIIQGNNANSTATGNLQQICGGVLISPQFVLTAAHCFNKFKSTSEILSSISVMLGSNSIASNATDRSIVKLAAVNIHTQFNSTTWDNDIAVLKLAVPVPLSTTINPICLTQSGTPFNNRLVITTGWGTTKSVNGTTVQTYLREAGMRTISNARCKSLGASVTSKEICAIGVLPHPEITAPCSGDSGGPLMLWRPKTKTYSLVGLVSNGDVPCAQEDTPTVFTRVNSFISFIKSVTGGSTFCSNSFGI